MTKSSKKPRKMIPVDEAIARWRKDPAYMKEYDALDEDEFALVAAIMRARAKAGLTEEQRAHE